MMRMLAGFLMLAAGAIACAQSKPAQITPPSATVHFVFDHPELTVTHFEIDVDAEGKAHYQSQYNDAAAQQDGIRRDFVLSGGTRERIFALVKKTKYLVGDFDFTEHRIAFTGTKTITYDGPEGKNTARFVWSENNAVEDLASIFQGISATLEEEPVLRRLKRHDRLGLNAELAKLEAAADSGGLREINLISEILKEIAQDNAIMGLARKRAERLLQKAAPALAGAS